MFDISKRPRLIYQGCETTWGVLAHTHSQVRGHANQQSWYIKQDVAKYLKAWICKAPVKCKIHFRLFSSGDSVSLQSANSPQNWQIHPWLSLSPLWPHKKQCILTDFTASEFCFCLVAGRQTKASVDAKKECFSFVFLLARFCTIKSIAKIILRLARSKTKETVVLTLSQS